MIDIARGAVLADSAKEIARLKEREAADARWREALRAADQAVRDFLHHSTLIGLIHLQSRAAQRESHN